jgi:hypothetical protein
VGEIRSFEDLIVWQKAHGFFLDVVQDIGAFTSGLAGRSQSSLKVRELN